ncbi:MAG: helix-turn-helix transcriptional regulator, partial [Candidatus Margulisbacteria bacterium]|nr:helix-turn-helix transcriptional regulator [Candidatus Margulisiibacteriota bacterium]
METTLEVRATTAEERVRALEGMLEQARAEIRQAKSQLASNVTSWVIPILERLRSSDLSEEQRLMLITAMNTLRDIVQPFQQSLSTRFSGLTPREVEVANLVKMGLTSRDIAKQLGLTKRAVEFHRDSLRRKLGLKGKG